MHSVCGSEFFRRCLRARGQATILSELQRDAVSSVVVSHEIRTVNEVNQLVNQVLCVLTVNRNTVRNITTCTHRGDCHTRCMAEWVFPCPVVAAHECSSPCSLTTIISHARSAGELSLLSLPTLQCPCVECNFQLRSPWVCTKHLYKQRLRDTIAERLLRNEEEEVV